MERLARRGPRNGTITGGRAVSAFFDRSVGRKSLRRNESEIRSARQRKRRQAGANHQRECVERPRIGVVVVRICQLGSIRDGRQSRNAIEMRMNQAVMIVVRPCMNVLKRREKKSQQESQADLQRNARAHFFDQSILPAPVLELRSRLEG